MQAPVLQGERTAATVPPEPFLLSILPLLLAPFPSPLPRALLSQAASQAIHYLSVSPDDEAYWTLGRQDEAVALKRRELIEAGNLDDLILSLPHFHFDLEELRCLISLSLPHSAGAESLGVVLVWEDNTSPLAAAQGGGAATDSPAEQDDVRPGWTFLELQALASPPDQLTVPGTNGQRRKSWYPTVGDALNAATDGFANALSRDEGGRAAPPAPLDFAALRDEPSADGGRGEEKARLKSAMEMAEGEGTTPGAIGSAEDFWAGWSDEEGAAEAAGASAELAGSDNEEYWAAYGSVDSQVGDDDDASALKEPAAQDVGEVGVKGRVHRSSTITPATANLTTSSAPHAPQPAASSSQGPLYFSTTLPPLTPSQFGLSPTQADPDASRFSVTSTSQYSPNPSPNSPSSPLGDSQRSPAQAATFALPQQPMQAPTSRPAPSAPTLAGQPISPPPHRPSPAQRPSAPPHQLPFTSLVPVSAQGRGEASPNRLGTSPSRYAPPSKARVSPQHSQSRPHSSGGPRHLRLGSDVLKALPSFPAFPVRPKAHSTSAPSTPVGLPSSQSGPANGSAGSQGYFATEKVSPSSSPHRAEPRSSTSPPPAPPKKLLTSPNRPATFAPQYTNFLPVGATRAAPPAPLSPTRAGPPIAVHAQQPRSPVSPVSPTSPARPPRPDEPRPVPTRSATQQSSQRVSPPDSPTTPSADLPRITVRSGSLTSPLPSTATFAGPSAQTPPQAHTPSFADPLPLPRFALPAAPRTLFQQPDQGRLRLASIDSTATGLTHVLGEFQDEAAIDLRAAAAFGRGPAAAPAGDAPAEVHGLAGSEETGADGEDAESLRFALAGVWGLWKGGARGREELDERRRRFERIVGEVLRS
ncbi:uncharacterized protein JCM10292_000530 [Rhodotorula paludigena]|uniref:uncharacterized protein n=1 Tax=Rhodotorula paludigena TaxID=86838 RepID=UPI003175E099